MPSLKSKFYGSKRLLHAWQRIELPARAPPLTRPIVMAMIELSLQQKLLWMAAVLAVGFHGFLRSGELLTITPGSLMLDSTSALGVLRLGLTKGGQRRGVEEAVTIDSPSSYSRPRHRLFALHPVSARAITMGIAARAEGTTPVRRL